MLLIPPASEGPLNINPTESILPSFRGRPLGPSELPDQGLLERAVLGQIVEQLLHPSPSSPCRAARSASSSISAYPSGDSSARSSRISRRPALQGLESRGWRGGLRGTSGVDNSNDVGRGFHRARRGAGWGLSDRGGPKGHQHRAQRLDSRVPGRARGTGRWTPGLLGPSRVKPPLESVHSRRAAGWLSTEARAPGVRGSGSPLPRSACDIPRPGPGERSPLGSRTTGVAPVPRNSVVFPTTSTRVGSEIFPRSACP